MRTDGWPCGKIRVYACRPVSRFKFTAGHRMRPIALSSTWWEPIDLEDIAARGDDPITVQMDHFCQVIKVQEAPVVSGREAIKAAAG